MKTKHLLFLAQIYAATYLIVTVAENLPTDGIEDKSIAEYVQTFKKAGESFSHGLKFPNLNIGMGIIKYMADAMNLGESSLVMGICNPATIPATILISRQYWEASSDLDREQLIFHELGHCVLGRDHNDEITVLEDGETVPLSLMNTYVIEEEHYTRYREEYIRELFTKVNMLGNAECSDEDKSE